MLDMPLAELRTYAGVNPRPPDFDAYWDRALHDLANVDPEPELTPAPIQFPTAECFHLYFTGVGGARIHAKFLRPRAAAQPLPALLHFHGYSGSSGDWAQKLIYTGLGYCVAAMDVRGQGGLSEDPGGVRGNTLHGHIIRGMAEEDPARLFYRNVFLDTAQLARVVGEMPEVDAARIDATGKSQGGALSLACGALVPAIRRLAPLHPFLSDYKRVWDMDLAKDAYAEIADYFRRFDPLHRHEDAFFTKLGYIDVHHLAPRVKGDVMMGITLIDELCPPSTQFAAYNQLTGARFARVYPDYGHDEPPGWNDEVANFLMEMTP
jgi:cephalosporin-C deacetylase